MRRMDEEGVRRMVDRLYEGTFDETLWPEITDRLKAAPFTPASGPGEPARLRGALGSPGDDARQGFSDSASQAEYIAGASSPVPFSIDMSGGAPPIHLPPEIVTQAPEGTPLRPDGAITLPDDPTQQELEFKQEEAPPRSDAAQHVAERTLVDYILRHLNIALRIREKFQSLRQRAEVLEASLDRLFIGVILIDKDKRVTALNKRARKILKHRDLEVLRDRLTTGDKRARIQLEDLLKTLVGDDGQVPAGGAVTIRRLDGHALQLWGAPLSQEERAELASQEHKACAILFLLDPDASPKTPESLLMEAFGLTRAETALAAAILNGETVDDYCERTGITRNTARTHMRAIFDKLGISKQTELVRLLAGFRMLDLG